MRKHDGFTMVEMLLVVAILAIVTTMAFPDFVGFFKKQRIQTDRVQMREIQSALEAHASAEGALPAESSWVADLAPYTYLGEHEISTDTHGVSRTYIRHEESGATYRAASNMEFHYGVVIASGGNDGGTAAELDDDPTAYALANLGDYEDFEPYGNDTHVKFTDRRLKMDAYNETLERMNRISDALANYAAYQQNEELAKVTPHASASQWVYYPPSADETDGTPAKAALYASAVLTETNTFVGSANVANSGGAATTDATRSAHMKSLMRLLGLPEDHCCSAIEKDFNGDPKAFFYYSNPIPQGGGCPASNRPGLANRKLPPRIATESYTCG